MMHVGSDISTGKDMSAGNDIIALAETDNDRTSRYRFYSRILTPEELPLCDGLTGGELSFSSFVWLMWSIKESVYKYVSRADPGLRFAPLKIPVRGLRICEDHYEGIIRYGGLTMFSRSFLWDKVIMTVVSACEDFSNVRWGMEVIGNPDYTTQSALVRKFALQSLSTDLAGAALRIIKTLDGPPELWDDERSLDIPLSLAHHGPYVAWSYRLPAISSSYRKSAANRAASSHLRRVNLLEITGLNRSCSSCEYSS
jgi:phosphopantetheinyl transferase (holo-ACP synthase)